MKKICVVLGTRPEIIKFHPVIEALQSKAKVVLIHTGQHYSKELNEFQLKIFKLKVNHQVKSKSSDSSTQIFKMMKGVSAALRVEKPDLVLVQGDTNSTMVGAICAKKLGLKLAHIEAGARCFDLKVPEEQNRKIVDHLSDLNFCYDNESKNNLAKEGITSGVIKFCNTAYGAVDFINKKHLKNKKIERRNVLATIHRAENTNDIFILRKILKVLGEISDPVLFPVHPRTYKLIKDNKMTIGKTIKMVKPLSYIDFLFELKNAKYVLADSGGIVDECVYFNVPLVVLREKTERNELVESGKILKISPKNKNFEDKLLKIIENDLGRCREIKVAFNTDVGQRIARSIMKSLK